jgi:hypothetical protein
MKRHVRRALAMVARDHPARIGLVVLAPAAPEDQQVLAGAGGEHAHALARHHQPECQHIPKEGAWLFQFVDMGTGPDDALNRRCGHLNLHSLVLKMLRRRPARSWNATERGMSAPTRRRRLFRQDLKIRDLYRSLCFRRQWV